MSTAIVVGRRRRSRVEAERLVLEFERSRLSRRVFCEQYGPSVLSLDQYRKRCRDVMSSSVVRESVGKRILPVEFVDAGASAVESPDHCGCSWLKVLVRQCKAHTAEVLVYATRTGGASFASSFRARPILSIFKESYEQAGQASIS